MSDDTESLPDHVTDSVQSLLQLREEHVRRTSRVQSLLQQTVSAVGRARFIAILTAIVLLWVGVNLGMAWFHDKPWDEPPFAYLQGLVALVALYTTILVLATQRHDEELAVRREQLTLQLSLLSERKSAKIIQLLEELRRDSPHLSNRLDDEAADMARPADPAAVLSAIADSVSQSGPAPDNA